MSERGTGKERSASRILFRIPHEKRKLGGLKRRLDDNIKLNRGEKGCEGVDWIELNPYNKVQRRPSVDFRVA
jgi:hypothetical protein